MAGFWRPPPGGARGQLPPPLPPPRYATEWVTHLNQSATEVLHFVACEIDSDSDSDLDVLFNISMYSIK